MDAELGILTGARAGQSVRCSRGTISVGRDATSDLRFDPELDLAVSARHAVFFVAGGAWHVRDAGSRNGTLVNGRLIHEDTPLRSGDRISFGADGPTVELRVPAGAGATLPGAAPAGGRFRVRGSRVPVVASAALGAVLLAGIYLGAAQRAAWNRERAAMRLEIDSLQGVGTRAIAALEQQLVELSASLGRSEAQVQALRRALAQAESAGQEERVADLRLELQAADEALRSRRTAAALDFRTIQERNRHAVARIFVEFEGGEVATGTAFAVRPDATLLTSRHVVAGEDGADRPRRIAIQFSDSEQVWPARILALSDDADLAVVKVDNIVGDVPTIRALNLRPDTLRTGAPVATIGFPLGGEPPRPGRAAFARPSLSAGVIRAAGPDRVEVEGYGASGASGSPILDANGEVVAVIFGGRSTPGGQSLFGTPSSFAATLLAGLP